MKRNLLESISTPFTGKNPHSDVKSHAVQGTNTTGSVQSLSDAGPQIKVRLHAQGLTLKKYRYYDLGPEAKLVHLVLDGTAELVELLPDEGLTFSSRLWNAEGWPLDVHVQLAGHSGSAPVVLKDSNGRHAYFTVLLTQPNLTPEQAPQVIEVIQGPEAEWSETASAN